MHPLIESTLEHPVYKLKEEFSESSLASMYHRVFREEDIRGNKRLSMFGSNNYLALAEHETVIEAARDALTRFGSATTGSRLLNGTYELHDELDNAVAALVGCESAISFPSGYQANVGTITALLRKGNTAVVDEYVHASVLDGIKMSQATMAKFRHNDIDHLREVLTDVNGGAETLIIVDSIYSMEGSRAPLEKICQTARDFGAAVMVDEAHGIGVFGSNGAGWVAECGVTDEVDVLMGSLSKAVASTGGFIAGSEGLIDILRYTTRSLIFSTSPTPSTAASALASIGVIESSDGDTRRTRVLERAAYLREQIERFFPEQNNEIVGKAVTPITPFRIGDSFFAADISRSLLRSGIYVGAAIYPAVPADGAILRLCVTANTKCEEIDRLIGELRRLVPTDVKAMREIGSS